jgi:hypothetical protein
MYLFYMIGILMKFCLKDVTGQGRAMPLRPLKPNFMLALQLILLTSSIT